MRVLTLFLALSGISLGSVDQYTGCLGGITTALSSLTFNSTNATDYYGNECTNTDVVRSMWAAAKLYCTPKEIEAGSEQLGGYCEEYGSVTLIPYSKVLPILTKSYISSLPVAEYSDIASATVFNTSVLLSESFYKAAKDTYVLFDVEYVLHQRYGWAIYGFWGGLLLIGMINRLLTHVSDSRRLKVSTDIEGNKSQSSLKGRSSKPIALITSVYYWFKSNLVIPAAFGSHHSRPVLWSTIPTRLETIVVVAFWLMVLILCCVGYYIFSPNLYYTKPQQGWRYIADRTGILSYATLPWLWLFSGRNNIFLWLTGWNYATFNIYHRHVARCATVLAIVHSINWSVLESNFGYFALSWKEQYWYMGGMATIAMSLLVFFSFMWFRVKSYEVFLLIHIALSVITLVGLYYHTIIFDGEYDPYLWPPVAIWSFDRAARLARWAYCNLHVKSSSSILNTKATASYISDGDFLRLEIVPGSRIIKPGPGQHYFLYQPVTWKGWENHPFTLAAYGRIEGSVANTTSDSRPRQLPDAQGALAKDIQVLATESSSGTASETDPQSPHQEHPIFHDAVGQQKLIFIVRPFGSWTKRLREQCLKSHTGVITPHIFIEGPYGEHSPLHTYENVVFIVGGSGISGALPYLQEHIKMTANDARPSSTDKKLATLTRDITFVWSARQASMIRDIATHELKPMLGREDIHIHLHATSRKDVRRSLELKSKIGSEGAEKDLHTSSSSSLGDELGIEYHRPNIWETILNVVNDVNKAGSAGGRIAILTCGPAGMADEARAAVHTALKQGKRGVEYFEETFGQVHSLPFLSFYWFTFSALS